MEDLRDILKRLDTTRGSTNDSSTRFSAQSKDSMELCDICGGRGWFTPDVPAEHAEFGKIVTCQCQRAKLEKDRLERLLNYSNLGYLARFTFDTLDLEGLTEDSEGKKLFKEAYQAAYQYVESPSGWLVFTGPNGSGKTHLAAAIANRCIENGRVVLFIHVSDLLDHLRSTFSETNEASYTDMFEQVRNSPLLVLDGLDSRVSTPWAEEKLQQIINHRYNAELPTIYTVASELSTLDPYIRTRLQTRRLSRTFEVRASEPGSAHQLGRIEPEMLRRMTFKTFDVRGANSNDRETRTLEYAYQAARNFAADPDGWLTLFSSNTGVGKTHLAVAVAAVRLEKGQHVFFAFVPELLDYLRYTFTPESRITYDSVFDELKNAPLLILDDLGREHSSPWAEEKLYQIIVSRHNARLPTIITSTMDFTKESGPISSRVQDPLVGDLIKIEVPDYRKKGRRGSHRAGISHTG